MKIKFISMLFVLFALLLAGCGQSDKDKEKEAVHKAFDGITSNSTK